MDCFCDISKAFDCVWHKGLIYKLKRAGLNGLLLDWLSDFLTNRKQRVVIPGGRSDWQFIRAGVPQGSTLSPLLFYYTYMIYLLIYNHVFDFSQTIPACT